MNNVKKLDLVSLVIILSIVLVLLIGGYLGYVAVSGGLISLPNLFTTKSPTTPLIPPTTNIPFAKITRVENNAIYTDVYTSETLPSAEQPIPPLDKLINLKVLITDTTTINQNPVFIPYLFIQPEYFAPVDIAVGELNLGDIVTLTLAEDLKEARNNTVNAVVITKNIQNAVEGTVDKINGNSLVLSGRIVQSPLGTTIAETDNSDLQVFTVTANQETEIGSFSPTGAIRYDLGQLTPGSTVTVYTNNQIEGTDLTAAAIIVSPPTEGFPTVPDSAEVTPQP